MEGNSKLLEDLLVIYNLQMQCHKAWDSQWCLYLQSAPPQQRVAMVNLNGYAKSRSKVLPVGHNRFSLLLWEDGKRQHI